MLTTLKIVRTALGIAYCVVLIGGAIKTIHNIDKAFKEASTFGKEKRVRKDEIVIEFID